MFLRLFAFSSNDIASSSIGFHLNLPECDRKGGLSPDYVTWFDRVSSSSSRFSGNFFLEKDREDSGRVFTFFIGSAEVGINDPSDEASEDQLRRRGSCFLWWKKKTA